MRSSTPDDRPERFAVVADQPLLVRSPIRRIRMFVAFLVGAIILGALGAIGAANASMNQRVGTLESDLASRRAARATQDAQVTALLEQYRETTCLLLGRVTPGPDVDRLRGLYRCDIPVIIPTPTVGPSRGR